MWVQLEICVYRVIKLYFKKIIFIKFFKHLPTWFFPILAKWVTGRVGNLDPRVAYLCNNYHRKVDNLKKKRNEFCKDWTMKKDNKIANSTMHNWNIENNVIYKI